MIPEVDGEASYLVLDWYDKKKGVLLLRERLADELTMYNDNKNEVYIGSTLEQFMENYYQEKLSPEIQSKVLDVNIEVCKSFSGPISKEFILGKVFALSAFECGYYTSEYWYEGTPIRYFSKSEYFAGIRNDELSSWWTRSADSRLGAYVSDVLPGFCFYSEQYREFGARPAFCLSGSLKIIEDELDGQVVYRLVD
ncbi:MAG: DUF6273 domain-containing protein [Clostridiales bacterium]|jgi:hypothetical protein|nr:DUF6273 domain-containing protein [Clostridiales bacterium]